MRTWICFLLAMAVSGACGAPEVAADASPSFDGDISGDCSWERASATFAITSSPEHGAFSGRYNDHPMPQTLIAHLVAGGCVYYGPEPSFCDPPCAEICAVGGICDTWPQTLSAGHLTVTGTSPTLELAPQTGGSYYTTQSYPNLYSAGDTLTLSATGTAEVPAFELTTSGVAELTMPWERMTATEHQDMVVTWDPADSPPGTQVILHMDSDHHGINAYVECKADDNGSLTVPSAVLDLLIEAGATGIGTYIENSWMARVKTTLSDSGSGCIGFGAESHAVIHVDTVLAAR